MTTNNTFTVFDEGIRRACCERINTPFQRCIGQDSAVEQLLDILYKGYSNQYHLVQENVMLTGPPSTGKTMLASMTAEALGIPVVLTDSGQVNSGITMCGEDISGGVDTIGHLILETWAKNTQPLYGSQAGNLAYFVTPPIVVFIDEIHGLTRKSVDGLLKATERSDGKLFGKEFVVDCKNVLWIGSTTDWGKLPPAFRSRFTKIELISPTFDEVVQIVKLNFPQFPIETCSKVVFYGSIIPREALAFARKVERYADRIGMIPNDCVEVCAQREGIDQWGMKQKEIHILQVLRNSGGCNLRNLCAAVFCEADELVKCWIPKLLFMRPPLVVYDGSVYKITKMGENELSKRNA